MSRPKGVLLILAILCLGVFATGCGGGDDGASEEQLQQAREEGAKEAADQAKLEQLEAKVNALAKKNRRAANGNNSGDNSSSDVPYTGSSSTSGAVASCGGGVSVGPNTTCEFAMNVAGEYGSNPGASSIQAFSPVTGQYYTLSCASSGGGTVCAGGNGATIYLP